MGAPKPEDFMVDKREGEFDISFSIRGTISRTIKATTEERQP